MNQYFESISKLSTHITGIQQPSFELLASLSKEHTHVRHVFLYRCLFQHEHFIQLLRLAKEDRRFQQWLQQLLEALQLLANGDHRELAAVSSYYLRHYFVGYKQPVSQDETGEALALARLLQTVAYQLEGNKKQTLAFSSG